VRPRGVVASGDGTVVAGDVPAQLGHIRQLDAVIAETIRRARALGAGPGDGRLVIDIDSTIAEVHGNAKHGAACGYTYKLGDHPILATRADTGEVLHARLRLGSANTQRGAKRFVEELIAWGRCCGVGGELVVRVDSGFWSNKTIETLGRLDDCYTMAVRLRRQSGLRRDRRYRRGGVADH
jgi:hypothetical protein